MNTLTLYPTRAAYMAAFNAALDDVVRAGNVLAIDVEALRQEAVLTRPRQ